MFGGTREAVLGAPASLPPASYVVQNCERLESSVCLSMWYFFSSWFAIGVISAYDAYLVKALRPVILGVEQNPVCSMLIHWDPQQLSYFFLAKATGTLVVLTALVALYCWRRRLALPVTTGVVSFQVGLLLYLNS